MLTYPSHFPPGVKGDYGHTIQWLYSMTCRARARPSGGPAVGMQGQECGFWASTYVEGSMWSMCWIIGRGRFLEFLLCLSSYLLLTCLSSCLAATQYTHLSVYRQPVQMFRIAFHPAFSSAPWCCGSGRGGEDRGRCGGDPLVRSHLQVGTHSHEAPPPPWAQTPPEHFNTLRMHAVQQYRVNIRQHATPSVLEFQTVQYDEVWRMRQSQICTLTWKRHSKELGKNGSSLWDNPWWLHLMCTVNVLILIQLDDRLQF